MKRFVAVMSVVVLLMTAAFSGQAHEVHQDGIQVGHPWARPTPPVQPINGAAYFVISNHRNVPIILEGASTEVTDRVSIHQTRMVDGAMRMEAVDGGLEIPAGATVRFEPGGYHLMLMNLAEPLRERDKFPLVLKFQGQEDVVLDVWVENGPQSKPAAMEMNHH